MSTHAIIALKNELRDAETQLKQREADSAEAITLGKRAQAVVDAAQGRVNDLTEAIMSLERIERENQEEVPDHGGE